MWSRYKLATDLSSIVTIEFQLTVSILQEKLIEILRNL